MRNKVCVEIGNNLLKIIVGSFKGKLNIEKHVDIDISGLYGLEREDFDEILLSDVLTAAFDENKIPKRKVRLVLSCISKLLLRQISLPIASKEETYNMVRYESQQFFPVNIENYVLDFKLLNRDKEKNSQDLLIAAVPKKLIEKILLACKTSELRIEKIDIEANALAKLITLKFQDKEEINSTGIIVNLERNFSTVVIVKNKNLVMAKTFLGSLEGFSEDKLTVEGITKAEEMVGNILKLVNFYRSREQGKINWGYITGELSDNEEIVEMIKSRLSIPILHSDLEELNIKSIAAVVGGLI